MSELNWVGLIVFSIILLATPGPAVISLLYSGINYGFKKSLPYFCGIAVGFVFNLAISAFGVGAVLQFTTAYTILKIAMLGYIFYLAYKIATSTPLGAADENRRLRFGHGVLLNLLNPKAYVAAMSAMSQFSLPAHYAQSVALIVAVNLTVVIIFQGLWCYSGQYVRRLFDHPKWYKPINVSLAVLLVLSVVLAYLQ